MDPLARLPRICRDDGRRLSQELPYHQPLVVVRKICVTDNRFINCQLQRDEPLFYLINTYSALQQEARPYTRDGVKP